MSFDVNGRLKEYCKTPTNLTDLKNCGYGDFFNEGQFRIETRWAESLICFVTVDLLLDMAQKSEEYRKKVIIDSNYYIGTLLANFFFSGWQINHYIRTGKRIF